MRRKFKLAFMPVDFVFFLMLTFDFVSSGKVNHIYEFDSDYETVSVSNKVEYACSSDVKSEEFDDSLLPVEFDDEYVLDCFFATPMSTKFWNCLKKFSFAEYKENYKNLFRNIGIKTLYFHYRDLKLRLEDSSLMQINKIDANTLASVYKLAELSLNIIEEKDKNILESQGFKVIRPLGQGIEGRCLLCRNLLRKNWDGTDCEFCAIKAIYLMRIDNSQYMRERDTVLSISSKSPHLVQVYDFFEKDGIYYQVMEYVSDSIDLVRLIRKKDLSLYEQASIALQYAETIVALHKSNLKLWDKNDGRNAMFNRNNCTLKIVDWSSNFEEQDYFVIEEIENFFLKALRKNFPESLYIKRYDEETRKLVIEVFGKYEDDLYKQIPEDKYLALLTNLKEEFN